MNHFNTDAHINDKPTNKKCAHPIIVRTGRDGVLKEKAKRCGGRRRCRYA